MTRTRPSILVRSAVVAIVLEFAGLLIVHQAIIYA
jgi:hypothetical protein